MIQAKNIASREDNFSPDEFKEKVNNFKNFNVIASAAYNNWTALHEETAKIWNSFVGDNPSCFGWDDKNAFQLMKNGFDNYDKAMVAGLLLKNLTNAHREEEELTNLTAIFKLMDME